jgi:cell division protein FtsQ
VKTPTATRPRGPTRKARTARAGRPGRAPAAPEPPPAPIDPRIRARRAEVLRTEARRRLRVALVALGVVVLVVAGWFAVHSRLFSARVVTVVGAVHTPAGQIVAAAGLSDHPPLIDVGSSAVAGVERLPWVAHATISREWPDGVRITVSERKAVAVAADVPASAGWVLVDRSGKVLAHVAQPPAGLVRVSGAFAPGPPGSTAGGLGATLRVVSSLPKAFAGQVTGVSEDRAGDVTLQLNSALTVYLGSTDQLPQKYEDVAAILSGAGLTSGATIDVAAPATPVVKP